MLFQKCYKIFFFGKCRGHVPLQNKQKLVKSQQNELQSAWLYLQMYLSQPITQTKIPCLPIYFMNYLFIYVKRT